MIPKGNILRELKKVDKLYQQANTSGDVDLSKFYSKLAVMELSGWIEECMDDVVKKCVKSKGLKEECNLKYVSRIIKRNHGFDYNNNFREMLSKTVGVVNLESIERKMNQVKKQELESALTILVPERNNHGHRTIQTTSTFTAPVICIDLLKKTYEGLKEYELCIKKRK